MDFDVVIIGAGAAGLMCAVEAGKRGRSVCVIDHSQKPAEKIRISGGGRCNFTNLYASPDHYISNNPHFCKSALSRYTQYDFIDLVTSHNIPYHEKKLGQLFCDNSANDIISMFLDLCRMYNVNIRLGTSVLAIEKNVNGYVVSTSKNNQMTCKSLVMACGGLSIPKIGATGFGYDIAKQFGHSIIETRAGLVPLTFQDDVLRLCKNLTGVSVDAMVTAQDRTSFSEGLLFTHRGLSGPSILQISSYWHMGEQITVNLVPEVDMVDMLKKARDENPKQDIRNILSLYLPKRLAGLVCEYLNMEGRIADYSNEAIFRFADYINRWCIMPTGSEGYKTAEVTLGGIDTNNLSSKTMESNLCANLYFIGECVDVTGHLGGFNFQWAWSSGWACGQVV